MSGRGILDADMTTLAGWAREGLRWWIDELAAMIPARWRGGSGSRGPEVWFDGHMLRDYRHGRIGAALGSGAPAGPAVVIARELALVRTLERPATSERDLARMLALDSDRLMPMPPGTALVAGTVVAREAAHATLEVAGLPRGVAETLSVKAADAGLSPTRLMLAPAAMEDAARIDFLPAFQAAGLMLRDRSAAMTWWGFVAFLFALNLGLLIWRDSARVAQLEDLVATQRPAVAAARAIGARVTAAQTLARRSAERRAGHDALATLAALSALLPEGAWVQRYRWDGATLKIAGYRRKDSNIATAMRASPNFVEVRSASSDALSAGSAGQPFDVGVRLVRRR